MESSPKTVASPAVGFNNPNNIFMTVVFPAPFFPTKPYIAPFSTDILQLRITSFPLKVFASLFVDIANS